MFKFGCLGLLLGGLWGIMYFVLPHWFLGMKSDGQQGMGIFTAMFFTIPTGALLGEGVGLVIGVCCHRRSAMIGTFVGVLVSGLIVGFSPDPLEAYGWMFLGLPALIALGTVVGWWLEQGKPENRDPASVEGSALETNAPGEDYTLK